MQRRIFVQSLIGAGIGLRAPAVLAQAPLRVVASFSILADMVREIGGDRVDVFTLVGPDKDAHTYQPTPTDAKALAAARVLVINGLGFEGWIERLARAAPFAGTRVVAGEAVPDRLRMTAEDAETLSTRRTQRAARTVVDPHCWQDLSNGRLYVRLIADALAAADPANAAFVQRRAADYDQRLAALDAWVRQLIGTVPAAKRKVITGHEAVGYFGRAYGIRFRAPVGISTGEEPSARDVAALVRQIRSEGIKAILGAPRLVEQIARETGAVVGPPLYVDALSGAGGPADTYEKMFRHNVPALVAGMLRN